MRAECIEAVQQAIGRPLKAGEADGIEKKILGNMTRIARENPQAWAGFDKTERYAKAAEASAQQLMAEAELKVKRTALNIAARGKLATQFKDATGQGMHGANAVERILNRADAYIKGVARENFSRLLDTINAADPRFFGLAENKQANIDFIREIFKPGSTGNEVAAKAAAKWLEVVEQMRQRFNRAGGDVGKLDYGYVPQSHDQMTILRNGKDAWVKITAPLLDRSRYLDAEGNPMGDAEYIQMLEEIWETLATGGVNKIDPNKVTFGTSLANRGSAHRQIHFKDADAWTKYHELYGKELVFDAMQNHVSGMSLNIGLLEEFGPNARAAYDMLEKMAIKQDGRRRAVGAMAADIESLYKVLSGEVNRVANPYIAEINQGIRNITVATKLQGTLLSSVNDIPTLLMAARYHNLPVLRTIGSVIRAFGSEAKHFANVNGLVAESIISDMSRFADGNMSNGITSKIAHATMKVQLLNAWTDSLKRGFQIEMMAAMGRMQSKSWDSLDKNDIAKLKFQGIDERMFSIWKAAKTENWRGSKMLTPDSIRQIPDEVLAQFGDPNTVRDEAVSRLLGFIIDESEYAVTTPDLTTRASLGGALQKGTMQGELARHASLFKSFPLAIANRHMRRAMGMNGEAGSFEFSASLLLGMITFGALSVQLKALVNGQDPAEMTNLKFWGKAMAQGGGLGIYGDMLYTAMGGENRAGQPNWASLGGPVFGTAADLANVTLGNMGEMIRGERTKAGAEIVRFAKQNTPFINLWYAKAAIDHMLLQDLQETLSPGYLARMRQRSRRDFGQDYWWQPGEGLPSRAPDFGNAIGE